MLEHQNIKKFLQKVPNRSEEDLVIKKIKALLHGHI